MARKYKEICDIQVNKVIKKSKNEKGSITIFVLLSMIFFVIILSGVFIASLNKQKSSLNYVEKIADNYNADADKVYNDIIITITYFSNGGNFDGAEDGTESIVKAVYNNTSTISDGTFDEITVNRDGYILYDWIDSEGNIYDFGEEKTINKSIELYANWLPIPDGHYYVGGIKSTEEEKKIIISNNSADENLGLEATLTGKTYKWIQDEKENSTSYKNTNIANSVSNYGGYFVDSRYNDSTKRRNSAKTYLDTYEDTDQVDVKNEKIAVCRRTGIWNAQDLSNFRDDVNAGDQFEGITVYVMDDIDLSTVCSEELGSWTPIGHIDNSKAEFHGTFDGQYHTISNLYINVNNYLHAGLFKSNNGTLTRIKLDNCDITSTYSLTNITNVYVGGICSYNKGHITECGVNSGTITINRISSNNDQGSYAGGIAGGNDSSCTISNCYNRATIFAIANTEVEKNYAYAGGIVGRTHNTIQYCYNTGTVTSKGYHTISGGVIGLSISADPVSNYCYNIGGVSGENSSGYIHTGGIIGNNRRFKL